MTIERKPLTYNLVGNLPDIVAIGVWEPTEFTLSDSVGNIIITETYHPSPEGKVEIKLKNILKSLVPCPDPKSCETQIEEYSYKLGTEQGRFYCLPGGHGADIPVEIFLKSNWLTWQPQTRQTLYHTPHYLRYAAVLSCECMAKGYFSDGTTQTVSLKRMNPGYIHTLDVSFGYIKKAFQQQPQYYDLWVQYSAEDRLTWVQRYVLTEWMADSTDFFLFENSLGGYDTIYFTGERKEINEAESVTGLFCEETFEYDIDYKKSWQKSTGYIESENERLWVLDFFNSIQRYHLSDGVLHRVFVSKPKLESISGEPAGYEFTFTHSKQSKYISLPRTEVPELLEIVSPNEELFFLAPRLNEYEWINIFDGDVLFPVQRANSNKWYAFPAALLRAMFNPYEDIPSNLELLKAQVNVITDSLKRYLRKDMADVASGAITFLKGIVVRGRALFADGFSTEEFVSGAVGEGAALIQDETTGKWVLEADSLRLRESLHVPEMLVDKIRSIKGSIIVSAGGDKVAAVDELDDNYLLTLEGDSNPFVLNDFIRCQVFNGDVKFYWVTVNRVDANSVTVSKAEFMGAVPEIGDDIVQLGNSTDPARQSAIYISATDSGAPMVDVLDGIKTKSLNGCMKVRLGNLNGITDAKLNPQGYGLYALNCFLSGTFKLSSGQTIEDYVTAKNSELRSNIVTEISAENGVINLAVKKGISELQFEGTRNLLLNSANIGTEAITSTSPRSIASGSTRMPAVVNGTWYMITFTAREINNNTALLHVELNGSAGGNVSITGSVWKRYGVLSRSDGMPYLYMWCTAAGQSFECKDFHLSSGSRIVDWSPAPEDYEASLIAARSETSAALEVRDNAIAAKVSKTDYDANNTVVGTRISAVEQTASSWGVKISDAKTEAINAAAADAAARIRNIQVGGVNIVPGTGTGIGWAYSRFSNRCFELDNAEAIENYIYSPSFMPLPGQEFTISFWAKKTVNCSSSEVYIFGNYSTEGFMLIAPPALTTEWQKVIITAVCPATVVSPVVIRFDNNGSADGLLSTLFVKDIKVEIGNVATAWSTAPEDNIAELDRRYFADVNKVEQSRYSDATRFPGTYGTVTIANDFWFGKVVEYTRVAGAGEYQSAHAIYDKTSLNNTDIVFYVVAKQIGEGGIFRFGGAMETFTNLFSQTANVVDLGNDWKMYWVTFCSGDELTSQNMIGINSVTGTWRFHSVGVGRGNRPPASWSPAPEDADASISKLRSDTSAELLVANNAINAKVSKTDYDANGVIINTRFSAVEQTADKVSLELRSTQDGLERAGIDIEIGKITLNSDGAGAVIIKNGDRVAALFEGGKIKSDYINVDTLVARNIRTADTGERVEMGVITGVKSLIRAYSSNGSLSYSLDYNGLSLYPTGAGGYNVTLNIMGLRITGSFADFNLSKSGFYAEDSYGYSGNPNGYSFIRLQTDPVNNRTLFSLTNPSVSWTNPTITWAGLTKRSAIAGGDWSGVFYNRKTGQLAVD